MRTIEWQYAERQGPGGFGEAINITVETWAGWWVFKTRQTTTYWGYYVTWYTHPNMREVESIGLTLELCACWRAIRNGFREYLKVESQP